MKFHRLLIALLLLAGMLAGRAEAQNDTTHYKAKAKGGIYNYVENKDSIFKKAPGEVTAMIVYDVNKNDSTKVYLSAAEIALLKFRDTTVHRNTLTSTNPFVTYALGSQYELVTLTFTKNDTCAVVWDSVACYSVSSYGDTALTGLRYTENFTDSTMLRVNWTVNKARTSSKKVLFLDPICKYAHIRLENYALTNRSVIITMRGAKR